MGEVRLGLLEPTTFTNLQMGKEMRFYQNVTVYVIRFGYISSFPFYMHTYIGQFTGQFLNGNPTSSKKLDNFIVVNALKLPYT